MKNILLNRTLDSHKGTFGRVAVIAGSKGMTGAPCLVSNSALKTGSGLVYLLTANSLVDILSIKLTEPIIKGFGSKEKEFLSFDSYNDIYEALENMDVLVLGPGIGVCEERKKLVREILLNSNIPIVLDADGLNCIKDDLDVLKNKKSEIVVTPHPGEMARLLKLATKEIQENREKIAMDFSKEYSVTVVLKGKNTVVASQNGEKYINMTGNPGMATAGSGDVLSGVIGSLIGQGIDTYEAAKLGVYIHGLAGDISSNEKSEYGVIASDIQDNIPYAIKSIVV